MRVSFKNGYILVDGCTNYTVLVDGLPSRFVTPSSHTVMVTCLDGGRKVKYVANLTKTTIPFPGFKGININDYLESYR